MWERRRLRLSPSGRQWDAEATYAIPAAGGWWHLGALWSHHPGHMADASVESVVMLRYRGEF